MTSGQGWALGLGPFTSYFELETLAPLDAAGGPAAGVKILPGALYGARIALSGLAASLADGGRLEREFASLGFRAVKASRSPLQGFPGLESRQSPQGVTWWLRGEALPPSRELDPSRLRGLGVRVLWAGTLAPVESGAAPVDAWALGVIDRAWRMIHGRDPSETERLFVAALSRGESYYGKAYGEAKNWGSIHASRPPCGPGSIPWTDKDANGRPYPICMRSYSTDEEGAADVVRQLTTKRPRTWAAIKAARTLEEIAGELRAERYYEAPAPLYAKMLRNNLAAILKNTGLADPFGRPVAAAPSGSGSGAVALLVLGLAGAAAVATRKK